MFLLEAPPRFELGESRICSPLPYHLAMAPSSLPIRFLVIWDIVSQTIK